MGRGADRGGGVKPTEVDRILHTHTPTHTHTHTHANTRLDNPQKFVCLFIIKRENWLGFPSPSPSFCLPLSVSLSLFPSLYLFPSLSLFLCPAPYFSFSLLPNFLCLSVSIAATHRRLQLVGPMHSTRNGPLTELEDKLQSVPSVCLRVRLRISH